MSFIMIIFIEKHITQYNFKITIENILTDAEGLQYAQQADKVYKEMVKQSARSRYYCSAVYII